MSRDANNSSRRDQFSQHDQFSQRDELCWLAYRYVGDEMSVEESASFEQRLTGDQLAREAVAEVVLLGQAVCSLPRTEFVADSQRRRSFVSVRSNWWQSVASACLGVAACLALMLLPTWFLPGAASNRDAASVARNLAGEQLAVAWATSLDSAEGSSDESSDELAPDAADESSLASREAELAVSESDLSVGPPSWMLEAIGFRRAESNSPPHEEF